MPNIERPSWAADIKALSFDLDETLWPLMPTILDADKAQNDWLAQHHSEFATQLSKDAWNRARQAVVTKNPALADNVTEFRKALLTQLFVELQPEGSADDRQAAVDDAFAAFQQARNRVYPYPGVIEVLEQLAKKFKLVAISNGNANVFETPLAKYFEWATSPMQAGVAKPNPKIFQQTCDWLGLQPEQVLHIGDDPKTDVAGAMGAGMRAAWYLPDGEGLADVEADWVISDLRGLLVLL